MNTRFFRFFASLNPFATIRTLRAELEAVQRSLTLTAQSACYLRERNEALYQSARGLLDHNVTLSEALYVADQAIDAFMDEREDLKTYIALQDIVGEKITEYAKVATAEIAARKDEAMTQAGEIVETVAYLKAVEAKLDAAGISIVQGTDGAPAVMVTQDVFVPAMARGVPDKAAGTVTVH